jgi:hypothetical protein
MKDAKTMTPDEKRAYIFDKNQSVMFPGGRFSWIADCLLGDMRTFLDGIERYLENKDQYPDRGGGNVCIPILVDTALELLSAMYVGETEYMEHMGCISKGQYRADKNVEQFVKHFFPEHYRKFPLLIWDAMRNGITHLFSPKPLQYQGATIRFRFAVEPKTGYSCVERKENTVWIGINDFELYELLKRTLNNYANELKTDETLKDNFISAWESIEEYVRTIDSDQDKSSEANVLLSEVSAANDNLVLWKDKPSEDVTTSSSPPGQSKGGQSIRLDSVANWSPLP